MNDYFAEPSAGLDSSSEEESGGVFHNNLTIGAVIPPKGRYLGLDISKSSTGIALVEDGEISTANLNLHVDFENPHHEALMRRQLRSGLLDTLSDTEKHFTSVIIEDVYASEFANTVRMLFALNTVIDDLILDGLITTDEFYRIQNGVWKRWLALSDPSGWTSSYNDKTRIRMLLEGLDYFDEGPKRGLQDRLDAFGMLVGFFLQGLLGEEDLTALTDKRSIVPLSNINFEYASNLEDLKVLPSWQGTVTEYDARVSQMGVRKAVTIAPTGTLFVTKKRVNLGNLGTKVGLDVLPFGGFLAFWRS